MSLISERLLTTDKWKNPPKGSSRDLWLHSFRRQNLLAGGRGTQKTGHLLYKTAFQAMTLNAGAGYYSVLTEQTEGDIDDTLIPQLRELINPDIYRLKWSKRGYNIEWATGHVTRLRSRKAKLRTSDPPFRGPTACYIGHDEIARDQNPLDEERNVIAISAAMQRGNAGNVKALDYTTTPQRNWFYNHCQRAGIALNDQRVQKAGKAAAFYEQTEDVDPELYQHLLETGKYSPDFADQELRARWVALKGRVWRSFADNPWPHGNTGHWATWDPSRAWCLGVDLGGAESAWIVAQYAPATDEHGNRLFAGNVLVAMAEFTPSQLGSFHVLPEVRERFGQQLAPFSVCIGHDVGTPGNSGDSARNDFVEHGWDHDIRSMRGWRASRRAQHQVGSTLLLDTMGRRRFALSKDFQSFYAQGRGLKEMFEGYAFPPPGSATYFDKDKKAGAGLEDVNDAFCYLAMGLKGDDFYVRTDRHAA